LLEGTTSLTSPPSTELRRWFLLGVEDRESARLEHAVTRDFFRVECPEDEVDGVGRWLRHRIANASRNARIEGPASTLNQSRRSGRRQAHGRSQSHVRPCPEIECADADNDANLVREHQASRAERHATQRLHEALFNRERRAC